MFVSGFNYLPSGHVRCNMVAVWIGALTVMCTNKENKYIKIKTSNLLDF